MLQWMSSRLLLMTLRVMSSAVTTNFPNNCLFEKFLIIIKTPESWWSEKSGHHFSSHLNETWTVSAVYNGLMACAKNNFTFMMRKGWLSTLPYPSYSQCRILHSVASSNMRGHQHTELASHTTGSCQLLRLHCQDQWLSRSLDLNAVDYHACWETLDFYSKHHLKPKITVKLKETCRWSRTVCLGHCQTYQQLFPKWRKDCVEVTSKFWCLVALTYFKDNSVLLTLYVCA